MTEEPGYLTGRTQSIAKSASELSKYARGFDHAVRNITAAIKRQLRTENDTQVDLGLQIALDIAQSYHGWIHADPAAAGENLPDIKA